MPGEPVHIVGGGLAGCEAAWQVTRAGVAAVLHEMRPQRTTAAHHTGRLAELVCSNSFRSDDAGRSAVGLLHEEMRRAGSLILRAADAHRVPAGSALAVDRDGFAAAVEDALDSEPLLTIERAEVAGLPPAGWDNVIVATGPLTSPSLADAIAAVTGEEALAFFDAIAPIVYRDSIDFSQAWFQSRYDRSDGGGDGADYVNCPLDRAGYERFVAALLAAERIEFRQWEAVTPYFEGCLPIEVMAARGLDTLRFGPMKPVGLTNPHDPASRPHAVVQLRQDNALATLYNIVGFQTKLTHGAQKRIFTTVPGLERARFARLGGVHRKHLPQQPQAARFDAAPEDHAQAAFRGADHRRRGLCRERGDGVAGGALRRRRTARRTPPPAAADDRPGRLARPHHRGRPAGDVPAHERQFRLVPAACPAHRARATARGLLRPRAP